MAEEAADGAVARRRSFLVRGFMGLGLVASHVVAGGLAARYLYPVRRERRQRMLVGLRSEMPVGTTKAFRTPRGQTINVLHGPDGFTALSDICPHLGCRVHWDGARSEFVCPCHDGHFAASGEPLSGPPKDMNTPLKRYDVVVEGNGVFLDVPVDG